MKRITIDIYDRDDAGLSGLINIQSEEYDFMYANDKTGHGLQCKYKGGTDQYVALGFRLARIADLARKIESSGTGEVNFKLKESRGELNE